MSKILIRGAKVLGGEPQDVLIDGETIAEVGTGLSRRGRRGRRGRRQDPAAGPGRPAHPPARAGPRGLRDRADRHARRPPSAASPPCTPWPTPSRSPTPPASSSRSGGSARSPATATCSPSAPSPSAWRASKLAELGAMHDSAAGVTRLLRRRQVRRRRRDHAPRPGVREGLRRCRRPARPGAAAHRGRPDERGRRLRRAGPRRLARGRRGVDHRPRCPARRARRLPRPHLPPVHRRLGRDRPLGQVQGLERHRRGHPAPPAAHRRAGPRRTTRSTR